MTVIVVPPRDTATDATAPSLAARAGKARSPGGVRLTPRSPEASTTIASATRTTVATARLIKPRFCMLYLVSSAGPSPASLRSAPSPAVQERDYEAFSLKAPLLHPGRGGTKPAGLGG